MYDYDMGSFVTCVQFYIPIVPLQPTGFDFCASRKLKIFRFAQV